MIYKTLPKELVDKIVKQFNHIQAHLLHHECTDFGIYINNEECAECKIIAEIQHTLWQINQW